MITPCLVCVIEADEGGGSDDAQSLRDSILRSPSDNLWSHHDRSDQGIYF